MDVGRFETYLRDLVPVVLGTDTAHAPLRLVCDAGTAHTFASDPQSPVLFVDQRADALHYTLALRPSYLPDCVSCMALLKRDAVLDMAAPLAPQLRVVTLDAEPGGAGAGAGASLEKPYETLQTVVRSVITPWFDAYAARDDTDTNRAKTDEIPMVKRKFAELALSLRHLQESVEIPHVVLTTHPAVRAAVEAHGASVGVDALDAALLHDDQFVNALHSEMNGWVRAVQKVTKLERSVESGSAMQEINFWNAMEHALKDVEQQLHTPAILLTLEILTHAKRFHATVSFHADTGIQDSLEKVHGYNVLMKDLPLGELLAASTLASVRTAVRALFSILTKKLRASSYPVARALAFVEAIGRDFCDAQHRVLGAQAVMQLDYPAFSAAVQETIHVQGEWEEGVKEFVYVARELTRKRAEKFFPIKIVGAHAALRTRLEYLARFRVAHEELVDMADVGRTWANDAPDASLLAEIHAAYDALRAVDLLDTSEKGTAALAHAEARYNAQIAHVENQLIEKLQGLLDHAQSARERLRILAQFNKLFVRPKVRAAVQEYQQVLLQSVQSDIDALHAKFSAGFRDSAAHVAGKLRGQPEIVGAMVWASEMERQLQGYLKRVEDVLGHGWEHYTDGQRIHAESAAFAAKLDTRPLLSAWSQDAARRVTQVQGPLLRVVEERKSGRLRLVANYDAQAFAFADEAHALTMLGMQIPQALSSAALDARRIHPFALAVVNALRTLDKVHEQLAAMPAAGPLLAHNLHAIHSLLAQASQARWERFLDSYSSVYTSASADALRENAQVVLVETLAGNVVQLEERVQKLAAVQDEMDGVLRTLRTCAYQRAAFRACVDALQRAMDALSLAGYANVARFVEHVEEKRVAVLLDRLHAELDQVAQTFAPRHHTATPVVLAVRLHGAALQLEPRLEAARSVWIAQLAAVLDTVLALPRLTTQHALALGQDSGPACRLLARVDPGRLETPLARLESVLAHASRYAAAWLELQFLWDVEPDALAAQLGADLAAWHAIARRLGHARATLEAHRVRRVFGGIVCIDGEAIQRRVALKLDAFQRAFLQRYAAALAAAADACTAAVREQRRALEPLRVHSASIDDVVALVALVQQLQASRERWHDTLAQYAAGEAVLVQQRVPLLQWTFAEQVHGELSALEQLLDQKRAAMDAAHAAIHARIAAEDAALAQKRAEFLGAWDAQKPVQGALLVHDAQHTLASFAAKLALLQAQHEQLAAAQAAFLVPAADARALARAREELDDLQSVWGALAGVWSALDETRARPWAAVHVRQVRQELDAQVRAMRAMPSRLRQYAAYEHLHERLAFLLKHTAVLAELRSDAFNERHWRALFQRVGRRYLASSHTLGAVWDLDWATNMSAVRTQLAEAQGEYALQVYLEQVRDAWTGYALELVNYRNECMLVRGFDALFQLATEHASALRAMGASEHYRVFEEEARAWEAKLARVQTVFDYWERVQRAWVYLHGLFSSTAETRHMLPKEASRFQSISTEFLAILRRAQKAPLVLEVVQQPGLEHTLRRLAELLHRIQKALGEYLERERARFARFYFVGDEDLLEILGSQRDRARAATHFPKMFPGLHALTIAHDDTIVGVANRAGEHLAIDPVACGERPVHEWLAALEHSVQRALLAAVRHAVEALDTTRAWLVAYPAQVAVLAAQIVFVRDVERGLAHGSLDDAQQRTTRLAAWLTTHITTADGVERRACEQLLTFLAHAAELLAALAQAPLAPGIFPWLLHLRHYLDADGVHVCMAHTRFAYGFEFLDAAERLVHTPLTTTCYASMTQALHARLGGAPFGPAGTGKTETIKALGAEMGRFVLVFNCDSQFDVHAMGRILAGVCRVGAWGCFDEFNRLEERVLSSVSQQMYAIQRALVENKPAELGVRVDVHACTGVFVTMNPRYAGRSHLPDNLKALFRSVAMAHPDKRRIVHVLLLVHGFQGAAQWASKMVLLFQLLDEQLHRAQHYDFGLRALKAVLRSAARVRTRGADEQRVLVQSVLETVAPKLDADDVPLLSRLVEEVFPGVRYTPSALDALSAAIDARCAAHHLHAAPWKAKLLQLYHIQHIAHGIILVGAAGTGKTAAWRTLLAAMEHVDGVSSVAHVIAPKVLSNEALYGTLDPTTREWTDGLFTALLRRILENVRREREQRHWIVFDGDIDPDWVENLNSVLDENKMLTLPTGERLVLPPNVRLVFEVDSVAHATRATITRCGMVAFGAELVPRSARLAHAAATLRAATLGAPDELPSVHAADDRAILAGIAARVEQDCAHGGLVDWALSFAHTLPHTMAFDEARAIAAFFSLLRRAARLVLAYNAAHPDFCMRDEHVAHYASRAMLVALAWACVGDAPHVVRDAFSDAVRARVTAALPAGQLLDYHVVASRDAPFEPWAAHVAPVELDPSALVAAEVVIPTLDTVRLEELVYAYLLDHRPVMLCGPPGSGKTMVLYATLRRLADVMIASVNLSSQTTPAALLALLEEHLAYQETPHGTQLAPSQPGRWLVVFCDEINLPAPDAYGTQCPIHFLRQLVEQRGFWRARQWIALERVQFVGACNPPTDPGRWPLTHRFLRHAPVVMVDYPAPVSLHQIYHTFTRALLRATPNLAGYAEPLSHAMVRFFLASQKQFTPATQAHYVYSPRELTRWIRGMYKALGDMQLAALPDLVRIWAFEGLRLFQDRLVSDLDKAWTDEMLDTVAHDAFPALDMHHTLARPILYADWLTRTYSSVDRAPLRDYAKARLHAYSEEEMHADLVLHDKVLDLALCCDRVLQQAAGHLLLIGVAGSGKTTVARFCAWLRGLALYSMPSARGFRDADFDEHLRALLRRVGIYGEQVCWTMDEAHVAHPARLEKLNTLLANAEVAGLFEGDEHAALLTALRDASQREGVVVATDDELLAFFRAQIRANLHIVLTMTPPQGGIGSKAAASPALFNRCTLVYCW
ncbi:hypothetical protein MVES1_003142 [Malassezia vespertilionis]|nr:uncharacterized protein MVES1_003142 [Malassezia vespertilionis]WFD07771.1 hypothetical protein MVES1_003142 [Malassezia vespertilionis]